MLRNEHKDVKVPYVLQITVNWFTVFEKPEARNIDIHIFCINLGLFGLSGSSILLPNYFQRMEIIFDSRCEHFKSVILIFYLEA